jgi:hypothetical protein
MFAPQISGGRDGEEGLEVESGAIASPRPAGADVPQGSGHGEKGLKSDAIGYVSNIVVGVASTAPGYSLAATLGFIVADRLVHPDALHRLSPTAT